MKENKAYAKLSRRDCAAEARRRSAKDSCLVN